MITVGCRDVPVASSGADDASGPSAQQSPRIVPALASREATMKLKKGPMQFRYWILLLATSLLCIPLVHAAGKDDPWNVLKHITHRSTLAFMVSGADCMKGKIQSVAADSIKIKLQGGTFTTIERRKLLRVEGYGVGVIYSGRSSWADVKAIRHDLDERARLLTKDGKKYHGKAQASDTDVTIEQSGKTTTVLKSNIAQVYFLTDRPASDSLDGVAQEEPGLAWLDPELWLYMAQKSNPIAVRLYDSSLPEDNAPVNCHD
jgi:hypothetical protein